MSTRITVGSAHSFRVGMRLDWTAVEPDGWRIGRFILYWRQPWMRLRFDDTGRVRRPALWRRLGFPWFHRVRPPLVLVVTAVEHDALIVEPET